jgi:hypothetical protein
MTGVLVSGQTLRAWAMVVSVDRCMTENAERDA